MSDHQHPVKERCNCFHHKFPAVFMVLFGLTFLLGYFDVISASCVNMTWPTLVILAGLFKLFSGKCKCCKGCNCSGCC